MTPIELFKIVAMLIGIITFVSGIIVKFTTHGNKISELEKDVNEIKNDMDTLEQKIDTLDRKVTELDSDIQIIKVTTSQTNDYVCTLLNQHNSDIGSIKTYVAQHKLCSNYQVNIKK